MDTIEKAKKVGAALSVSMKYSVREVAVRELNRLGDKKLPESHRLYAAEAILRLARASGVDPDLIEDE